MVCHGVLVSHHYDLHRYNRPFTGIFNDVSTVILRVASVNLDIVDASEAGRIDPSVETLLT